MRKIIHCMFYVIGLFVETYQLPQEMLRTCRCYGISDKPPYVLLKIDRECVLLVEKTGCRVASGDGS